MKYTEQELWAFVHRADTREKINFAIEWLKKNFKGDMELFDDLMVYLAFEYREMKEE